MEIVNVKEFKDILDPAPCRFWLILVILADFPNIYLHGAGSKISLNSLAFTMSIIGVHTMSFSYAPQKN